MIKKTILILACLSFTCKVFGNHWYSEYWQRFFWNMWECGQFGLRTYVDIRTRNHLQSVRHFEISEQLFYEASKNITLEFHYTYAYGRSVVAHSPWHHQHRLEFEANRIFDFHKYLIATRNRFEIRKRQNNPKIEYRLRQRTMLVFPIEEMGRLKSFSIYNEIFYNLSTHLFSQNRFYPFQLNFIVSDQVDLDVFFMIGIFFSENAWRRNIVIGTQLNF